MRCAVGLEFRTPLLRQPRIEHLSECRTLDSPDSIAIKEICGVVHSSQRRCAFLNLRTLLLLQVAELGNILDVEVNGIRESTGHRQVRRVLDWQDGSCGMQRIDKYEPGSEFAAAPRRKRGEIMEIADPPRFARARRVDLRHEAPLAIAGDRIRIKSHGSHDQRGLRLTVIAFGVQRVPPESKINGDGERSLANQEAVNINRRCPVVDLRELHALT